MWFFKKKKIFHLIKVTIRRRERKEGVPGDVGGCGRRSGVCVITHSNLRTETKDEWRSFVEKFICYAHEIRWL